MSVGLKRLVFTLICTTWATIAFAQDRLSGWADGDRTVTIQGGKLIDVRSGDLIDVDRIVIDGDSIVSVNSSARAPDDAIVIDATGKFIIPGLIDLHVHYKDWSGPLYLNHGVTTVTSLGDTYAWIRAQKEGIKRGVIEGPRLFISTENLDRTPEDMSTYYVREHVRLFDDADDARKGMQGYIEDAVDAVKVYAGLSKAQLKAIVEEAGKAKIPVIGHFQDVYIAAEVGGHGIEHTNAVANAILDENAREKSMRRVRDNYDVPAEAFMEVSRIPEIVKFMVDNGLYLNPTIRMGWQPAQELRDLGFHYEDFDLTVNDWRLRFVPISWRLANLKEYQEVSHWNWRDLSDYERGLFEQGYRNVQRLIKEFYEAGGKLYTGTDSANMATPGLSLHQEMELFVAAGLPPLAALQASTINPAELMGMAERLGTVDEDKAGDLIILDGNPLVEIRNTRKIWKVISRGVVLSGEYHADYKNPIPKTTPFQSSHFFPSPRIKEVGPKKITLGEPSVTLVIEGTGFIPYSFVRWDEQVLETEFVNEHELRAIVPADLIEDIGTFEITVENPDFAWGTIYASGASDLVHLGIRDRISNGRKIIVAW